MKFKLNPKNLVPQINRIANSLRGSSWSQHPDHKLHLSFFLSQNSRFDYISELRLRYSNLELGRLNFYNNIENPDIFEINLFDIKCNFHAIKYLKDDEAIVMDTINLSINTRSIFVDGYHWVKSRILKDCMFSDWKHRRFISVYNFSDGELMASKEFDKNSDLFMFVAASGLEFRIIPEPKFSPYECCLAILDDHYLPYVFHAMPFKKALKFGGDHILIDICDRIDKIAETILNNHGTVNSYKQALEFYNNVEILN